MFQICTLHINLDIQIALLDFFLGFWDFQVFRVICLGSVNNTSDSDMICNNTLQNSF